MLTTLQKENNHLWKKCETEFNCKFTKLLKEKRTEKKNRINSPKTNLYLRSQNRLRKKQKVIIHQRKNAQKKSRFFWWSSQHPIPTILWKNQWTNFFPRTSQTYHHGCNQRTSQHHGPSLWNSLIWQFRNQTSYSFFRPRLDDHPSYQINRNWRLQRNPSISKLSPSETANNTRNKAHFKSLDSSPQNKGFEFPLVKNSANSACWSYSGFIRNSKKCLLENY